MEITCPSGLRGEIRKLKVRELAMFSDLKLVRQGRLLTEIVKSCWVKTHDRGPYTFPDVSGTLPWETMLHADRMFAFKEIRIATHGPAFEWEVQDADDTCKHRFIKIVDLSKLEITPLPETSKQHVATGAPFYTEVDGSRVKWRLLRAGDDPRLLRYVNEHGISLLTAGYMCRIVDVDGVDVNDPEELRNWIENLDVDVAERFEATMDMAEASVNTRIDITCSRRGCENSWKGVIPLAQAFLQKGTPNKKPPGATHGETSSEPSTTSLGDQLKQAGQI